MSATYRVIAASELDATLLDAWREIQSRNSIFSSPYFCPEFTQLTGEVRNDVRIVVIENDGHVAGFFPFQRSFLSMGKPVGGPLSDYHGVIAGPDAEWEIKPLMQAAGLSVWSFNHLVDGAGKFDSHISVRTTSPQIDLGAGYEHYVETRRKAGSDYIRKTEGLARKLEREFGQIQFTLHDPGRKTIDQLIRWKSAQYRDARLTDAFSVPWTGELLNRISQTQAAGFAGVCSVLRLGNRMIAIHSGMRSSNLLHYWFPAYDQTFAKFSPGIILLLRMAKSLENTGVRTIDLGHGSAQYKQRLMTHEVPINIGYVERPSLGATIRRIQRIAEAKADNHGMAAVLRMPLKAIRRIERTLKYH